MSTMRKLLITAIEIVRQNLHVAAQNAGYDYQCKEVQKINARLDRLIYHFMKQHKLE